MFVNELLTKDRELSYSKGLQAITI